MKKKRSRVLSPETIALLKHIGFGLLTLAVVAGVIIGIWHGTRLPSVTLTTVEVSGGKTVSSELVRAAVATELNGSYLGLIPYRFAWLYPEESVYESVQDLERVHDVEIERVDGETLNVTFDEHIPTALWCKPEASTDCYFLDSAAYAFTEAPHLAGSNFLRFITSGREPVIGHLIADPSDFNFFITLADTLAAHEWFVASVEIDQVGDGYLTLQGGSELKVSTAAAPTRVVDNLLTLLTTPNFGHLAPGNFQYIDLRFGEKIYVQEDIATTSKETTDIATTTPPSPE